MPGVVTREDYIASLHQLSADARELANRYSLAQLTWQPRGGEGWSMLECLDHLTVSNSQYLDSMNKVDTAPGKESGILRAAGFPSAKFIGSLEPPVIRKIAAPLKIRPRATLHPERILPEFLKTLDRSIAFVEASRERDLNHVRFPNPILPVLRFTIASGLLIMAAHGRRHIWQAQQVPLQPGFPAQ